MRPNNLKRTLFRVNCSEWLIAEFVGVTSVPYNRTRTHVVLLQIRPILRP